MQWLYQPRKAAIQAILRRQLKSDRDQQIQLWQQTNQERGQASKERVVRQEPELKRLQQGLFPAHSQGGRPADLTAL